MLLKLRQTLWSIMETIGTHFSNYIIKQQNQLNDIIFNSGIIMLSRLELKTLVYSLYSDLITDSKT